MDFSKLNTSAAAEKPRTVIVKIGGEPTDVEIDIIGSQSQKARRAQAEFSARAPKIDAKIAQLSDRLANMTAGTPEHDQAVDALAALKDARAKAMCRLLAQHTVGWRRIEVGGVPVDFSEDVAESFYAQSEPMFLSVLPEISNTEAFLGNVRSTGSSSSKPNHG